MRRKGVFYAMHYGAMIPGRFCARPNRFVAQVELEGREETCHVKTRAAAGNCYCRGRGFGAGMMGIRTGRPIMI